MRTIEFKVTGHLPPKKDGANSMWNKASERARLVALRQAAYACCGEEPVLSADIRLSVQIHCAASELLTVGDLDNFITGVCDGLMVPREARPSVHGNRQSLSPFIRTSTLQSATIATLSKSRLESRHPKTARVGIALSCKGCEVSRVATPNHAFNRTRRGRTSNLRGSTTLPLGGWRSVCR